METLSGNTNEPTTPNQTGPREPTSTPASQDAIPGRSELTTIHHQQSLQLGALNDPNCQSCEKSCPDERAKANGNGNENGKMEEEKVGVLEKVKGVLKLASEASQASLGSDWKDEDIVYPDGGLRAWMVVIGGTLVTFSTFGFANSWGVFQAYYETTMLPTTSPSAIAWIGSMQYSLVYIPGVFAGRLCDLGYFKVPFITGASIAVLAIFLIAESTKYWQLLVTQGIMLGLGAGICDGALFPVVAHWWYKRRGLVFGLAAVGASAGGAVYPIAARELIPLVGFPWTMRIMGFFSAFALGSASILVSRRLPPKKMPGGIFNLAVFKNKTFSVYCGSTLVIFLGIYTVLTYIDIGATRAGISPEFSFYLVSIANASAAPTRVAIGLLADRFGAVNVIVPFTLSAAILTFAWPYATTKGSLIALAVLYGMCNSAFASVFNLPLYTLGDMGDVGRRVGIVMFFTSIGALVGPPISGALYDKTGGMHAVSYYAGGAIILGCSMMLYAKYLFYGGTLKGKW
ncbi:monocarboxylate permease [Coprinopsis cinerea AmutBmut pab1-1]|nr:monocarboxylate permease [Coprinopsis cinerea AmutBmut pab1-1]